MNVLVSIVFVMVGEIAMMVVMNGPGIAVCIIKFFSKSPVKSGFDYSI